MDLQLLERFAGKTTSFAIAVPAARLFTRVVYRAIGANTRKSHKSIKISRDLFEEIAYWRFLENWKGHLPWFEERHRVIKIYTDAFNSGWGGVLFSSKGEPSKLPDYWTLRRMSKPIVIKEALALQNSLSAVAESVRNCCLVVHTDSLPLVQSWKKQGGKSTELTAVIKSVYRISLQGNCSLTLHHVHSKENLADPPSRVLAAADCMLAKQPWGQLENRWGPHSIDLMSLDVNAQCDRHGVPLRHFTPWPTPHSSGINVFSQIIPPTENAYVFPPLVLVGPIMRFMLSSNCSFTAVVPDVFPRRFWWPLLCGRSSDSIQLGVKDQDGILLYPSRQGTFVPKALLWDLWAFRMSANNSS